MSAITAEVIRDSRQLNAVANEWNLLWQKSGTTNPFLRHEWFSAWWKGYGQDKELFVICFRRENEITALIPLMKYRTNFLGLPLKILGFISNHWVTLDMLFLNPDDRLPCLMQLLKLLKKDKAVVVLSYFAEYSDNLPLLGRFLYDHKIKHHVTPKFAPYIPCSGTWDEYLKKRTHRFRAEYKKKRSMLEGKGRIEFLRFTEQLNSLDLLDGIEKIARRSWQGQKGVAILSSSEGRIFYEELLKVWAPLKCVDISLMRLDGTPIAYLVGFRLDDCFYVFDTAYDEHYKELSPGMVVHNMLLEQLFAENIREFDFGYMADYKKRWTERTRTIFDVTIFPKGLKGRLLWWAACLKTKFKENNAKRNH